jgi:4-amino-4-deoxy-L-arabinose transferase-like glycosyltransferase
MRELKELALISLLVLIVRLPWLFMIPMVEAPDEATHAWVIHFCAAFLRLPCAGDISALEPIAVYASIPQFGYLPHIICVKLIPLASELIRMRFASLLNAWLTVLAAYLIGQEIFAGRRLLALGLPLMLVFHPQFVFVSSYANNDVTTCALASLILLLNLKALKNGLNLGQSFVLGLLLAWIALSKYSGVGVILTGLIFYMVAAWLHRSTCKDIFANFAAVLLPFLSLPGLWFYRNYLAFNGDVTGTRTMHYIWSSTYHRKFDSYRPPWEIILQSRWWRMNFFSFWGWFGYMTRSLPRPFYYGYLTFLLLAATGGCKALLGKESDLPKHKIEVDAANRLALREQCSWAMLIFLSLITFLSSLAASSSGIAGPQGRYLFPAEIPLMALLLAGLSQFGEKRGRLMIWALLAFNAFTYFYSSAFLLSLYGFPIR